MIFNALIPSLTTRRVVKSKLQTVSIKPDACEIYFRNKYHQKEDKQRFFNKSDN